MQLFLALLLSVFSFNTLGNTKAVEENFIDGEVIIKLKSNVQKGFLSSNFFKNNDLKIKKEMNLDSGQYLLVKYDEHSFEINSIIDKYSKNPNIEYIEPNYIFNAIGNKIDMNDLYNQVEVPTTNDPHFGKLWGLKNTGNNEPKYRGRNSTSKGVKGADINAVNAWKITKGSKAIKIAVIDTGVDYNHEDLKKNMWVNQKEANGKPGVDDDKNGIIDDIHGARFITNKEGEPIKDGNPMDGNGHGTHCAGTIAGVHNNGKGVAGVMAQAQIVAVKFLTDQGSGTTANAIEAIDYATKVGVDIMSNSWGGGGFSQALKDAVVRAKNKGIIFTAAAGNFGSDNNQKPQYPANFDVSNVISVASHTYNEQLSNFSCYGSRTVHIAAPGHHILSSVPGNKYAVYSGTSMATPHVSGAIGLYLALHGKQSPKDVRETMMNSAKYAAAYGRKTISSGRLDTVAFLNQEETPRPETPNDNDWQDQNITEFKTDHPYANNSVIKKSYTIRGAKFIRVKIKKYAIEENYDALKIYDGKGNLVQTIDGSGSNFVSEYIIGDSLKLQFQSDSSVNDWGVLIEKLQYID